MRAARSDHYPAMTYARDEAIRIVDWVLQGLAPEETICVELPFLDVRRKADIAILSPSRLSAIEIKGDRDNTVKLEKQLADYRAMFLDVTVATTPRHLQRVRSLAPRDVGILLLEARQPVLLRKPTRRARLSPESASRWLTRQDLSDLLGAKLVRDLGSAGARDYAARHTPAAQLSRFAVVCASKRNEERYRAFRRERGSSPVDLDDLSMLALQQNVRR